MTVFGNIDEFCHQALPFPFVPFAEPETQEKGEHQESEAIVEMDIHVHLLFRATPI